MRPINKWILYTIEISVIILAILLFATYYNFKRADTKDKWLRHTSEILMHTARIQLEEAEGDILIRDFMLTGDPALTEKFTQSAKAKLDEYKHLRRLTKDDKVIQPILDSLGFHVYERSILSVRIIKAHKIRGQRAATRLLGQIPSSVYGISRSTFFLRLIEKHQSRLMVIRKEESENALLVLNVSLIITFGFIFTFIVLMMLKFKSQAIERSKLIEELEKNEERNNKAEKLALYGTWRMDLPRATLNSSHEMKHMWGFEPDAEKIALRDFINKVHPNDRKPLLRLLRDSMEKSGDIAFQFRLFNNGDLKYFNAGMTIVRNDQETLIEVTGYVQDITEKTVINTKLLNANRDMKMLFNRVGEVLFSRDIVKGKFIMVSDNCEELTGYTTQEFIDQPELWITIMHENDRYLVDLGNAQLAAGRPTVNQFRIIRKDGIMKWIENKIIPLMSDDGDLIRIDSVIKNITNKKLAEIERDKIIADIVQRNRTLELFTYIVSHNLRAPVANIYGLCQLLELSSSQDSEANEVLEKMSTSIKSLDIILNDLSRVLQTRENINETKETVDLSLLLEELKVGLGEALINKNIQIKSDFSQVRHLFSIHSHLYSIFYNLVLNSINYRRKDIQTLISIKTVVTEDYIELLFADNGKGIDMEKHRSTVFGLYRRFDLAIAGKGIGLFTTKTQVEALGGTIDLKSVLNEGTTFSVKFMTGTD